MLIAAVVVGWLCLPWALSWLMGRRGYERPSWWILAMLMGPAAVPLALSELLVSKDRRPVVLERGHLRGGGLSVLVQVEAPLSLATRPRPSPTFSHLGCAGSAW